MNKLKSILSNKNISIDKLAKESGLNRNTVKAYVYGTKNINNAILKNIVSICTVLGCDIRGITDDSVTELLNKYEENNGR